MRASLESQLNIHAHRHRAQFSGTSRTRHYSPCRESRAGKEMKILHLFHHSNLTNGVDRTALTLLTALQQLGVEVRALAPARGEVTEALDASRVLHRIAPLGCCTGSSKVAELNYLSQAVARAQLIEQWLRVERVDLVHLNTGHLLDGAIAASKSGVPAIWHIHSPFDGDYQRYARVKGPAAYGWLLSGLGEYVNGVSHAVRICLLLCCFFFFFVVVVVFFC